MGKTKRASNQKQADTSRPHSTPPCFPCTKPYSSKVGLMSEEKPIQSVDSGELKNLSSIFDTRDCSTRLLKPHDSTEHQERSLDSLLLKRSRNRFGHHYSRRGSKSYTGASTSRGKDVSIRPDDRLSFQLPTHSNTGSAYHYSESWEKTHKPERIRSRSLMLDPTSVDVVKVVCGICEMALRRKTNFLSNIFTPSREQPVVAVLVCGHVYHADCLERRTRVEDQRDPPCPSCLSGVIDIANERKEKAVDII